MDDVTRRLRISVNPDAVDRERYMAGTLFGDAMRESEGRVMSEEHMARLASQSIRAACVFWEAWDIACLTYPQDSPQEPIYGYCVGEMR